MLEIRTIVRGELFKNKEYEAKINLQIICLQYNQSASSDIVLVLYLCLKK